MNKKDSNFFEKHIEKIILAVVAMGCIFLSYSFVVKSPGTVTYDGQKFGPGTIDKYILDKQVGALENRLNREPEPKQPYKSRVDDFVALFNSAISDIDISFILPQPIISAKDGESDREYRMPAIGKIDDVSAEHIRTVAYVPASEETVYDPDSSEPNDIDFVTVEAKFNVSGLYKNFNDCFAGEDVRQDWRDPRLAVPIFAAVQLQRQELLSNGFWSSWQTVPRSRIDPRKRMFEIIEDINDLPAGGVKVRLLQFDDAKARIDLLQPEAYQIAFAKEEWLPPSLHEKYLNYQKEIDVIARREATAEKKVDSEAARAERRSRISTPGTATTATSTEGIGSGTTTSTTSRKTSPRKGRTERETEKERPQKSKEVSKTINDVYQEFDKILITDKTDLAGMDTPLVFWAFDDTIKPGNSYRYRVRLGVFNPVAGTNQVREQDKSLKNKVILWSNFSDTTKPMDVPQMLYFFPCEQQETTKTVTVQVSKYVLGYWYSKDFSVKPGEFIGKAGEYKMTDDEKNKNVTVPSIIDYTTGAVMVDMVPVTDWSGGNNLHVNHFFDLLYSFNGKDIARLSIKSRYWTEALQNKFNEIKRYEKEPKEPLRSWESRATQRGRGPATEGMEGIPSEGLNPP